MAPTPRSRTVALPLGLAVTSSAAVAGHEQRPNILYLLADDMRPQLGSYGHAFMKTPHLDKLSASGLHFDFAYTNFAYCAPSRNSFMSGRRPDRTKALNFLHTFREAPGAQNWTSMPEFFKKRGYFTTGAGKIYHDKMDDAQSWSYPSNQTWWVHCQKGDLQDENLNYCGVTNQSAVPYPDEELALGEGLLRLDAAQASGKPWFVAIGVHRPHHPGRVPPGFYGTELYPPGPDDVVKPPAHPSTPEGAPWMSGEWIGEDYNDPAIGNRSTQVPPERAVEYRRWYYAAVTWADHCLGRALSKLDDMGVANNTIVIFHSDHGYQLGELNEWAKKTNTELATHVPMMVRVPWKKQSLGKRTTVRAELVDVYRTLAELAGFHDVEDGVQGVSLASVFDDPLNLEQGLSEKAAFSQIGRCGCHGGYPGNATECGLFACHAVETDSPKWNFMGYTMRTARWRFTAWLPWDHKARTVAWSEFKKKGAVELFDLANDTGRDFDFAGYSTNLAVKPEYAATVQELQQKLFSNIRSWGAHSDADLAIVI